MTTENNVAAQAGDEPMPCPFCGGAPQVDEEHDDRGNRVIECEGCGANVGANMLSAGWRRWNQRVSQRATADVDRDAARFRMCVELCHDTSNEHGNFTGVMLPAIDGEFRTTDQHFIAAIDAAIATTKQGA